MTLFFAAAAMGVLLAGIGIEVFSLFYWGFVALFVVVFIQGRLWDTYE